ncbi:MAG: transglutaminase domain-containing protein [Candidatus Bipolaricaulota bacterium]
MDAFRCKSFLVFLPVLLLLVVFSFPGSVAANDVTHKHLVGDEAGEQFEVVFQPPQIQEETDKLVTPGDRLRLRFRISFSETLKEIAVHFYSASELLTSFSCDQITKEIGSEDEIIIYNSVRVKVEGPELSALYDPKPPKTRALDRSILIICRLRTSKQEHWVSSLQTPFLDGRPAQVVYPNYRGASPSFLSDPPTGQDNFYFTGDRQFSNVNDVLVRRLALNAALEDGGTFPDSIREVIDRVYLFTARLLEPDSWSEEEIYTSKHIARWWEEGKIAIEKPYPAPHEVFVSPSTSPPGYICVEHAYLFTSLLRTLGIPARELNVSFPTHIRQTNGEYRLGYYCQEAAAQAYYQGEWHLFDPFLEHRSFDDYLSDYWSYQAWYAYSARDDETKGTKLGFDGEYGHNFRLKSDGTGVPEQRNQWRFLERQTRPGVAISLPPGKDEFRLLAISADGRKTGYDREGQIHRDIRGSIYYEPREIGEGDPESTHHPDIIFLPLGDGNSYRIIVHKKPSSAPLLSIPDGPNDLRCKLIFIHTKTADKTTSSTLTETLAKGADLLYEVEMGETGDLRISLVEN